LLQVRASLYDLLSHCIDSTTIIKTLTWKLIPKTDDALKPEVIKWAAFYEHRCKMGSKQIFHLEAFVAKYMRLYERYVDMLKMFWVEANMITAIPWASTLTQPERDMIECALSYETNLLSMGEASCLTCNRALRGSLLRRVRISAFGHYVITIKLPFEHRS
jgi:hypothetical protein